MNSSENDHLARVHNVGPYGEWSLAGEHGKDYYFIKPVQEGGSCPYMVQTKWTTARHKEGLTFRMEFKNDEAAALSRHGRHASFNLMSDGQVKVILGAKLPGKPKPKSTRKKAKDKTINE
jgi:hypothetical protein